MDAGHGLRTIPHMIGCAEMGTCRHVVAGGDHDIIGKAVSRSAVGRVIRVVG